MVIVGFCLTAIVMVLPLIVESDPLSQNQDERLMSPSLHHLFGTDGFGRDIFVRVLYGARNSLLVAISAIVASSCLGVPIGGTAAISKRADRLIGRVVDIFIGIPFLILLLIIIVAFGAHIVSMTVGLAIVLLPRVIRFAKGSMIAFSSEPYIEAAVVSGASRFTIFRRHLMRNAIPSILAYLSGLFGTVLLAETSLSFLGLGIPAPYPSLGGMLKEGARLYLESAPWMTIFPGITIAMMVLTANILSGSFRKNVT